MNIIIGLLIVATLLTYWAQLNNGQVIVGPIIGVMFGVLYSYQEIEDDNVIEYCVQCCILFISITVLWEKPMNG
jgi:hypothetical protein